MSKYYTGLRSVGAYQVSGQPFVTGSTVTGNAAGILGSETDTGVNGQDRIDFPFITKSIVVTRTGGANDLLVSFRSKADGNVVSGHHYWTLTSTDSITMNVKCKEIYVWVAGTGGGNNANYEIFAELTNITTGSMYTLVGEGITD